MNPFKRLLNLLPQRPRQVGDAVAAGGGVCSIQLPGGGVITARGAATVGDHVFVRDGVIEGEAPTLGFVEIEV